jgi:hypothetical protein
MARKCGKPNTINLNYAGHDNVISSREGGQDEGETVNDNWAMTSNWIYYKVEPNIQPDISKSTVKLLGSMFPQEEFSFTGRTLEG